MGFLSPLDLVRLFHLIRCILIRHVPSGGDANTLDDFNPIWIAEFKHTNAFDVWQRTTDPMLFDIVEPRHAFLFHLHPFNLLIFLTDTHVMRSLAQLPT